jgi:hypothetical protein
MFEAALAKYGSINIVVSIDMQSS